MGDSGLEYKLSILFPLLRRLLFYDGCRVLFLFEWMLFLGEWDCLGEYIKRALLHLIFCLPVIYSCLPDGD